MAKQELVEKMAKLISAANKKNKTAQDTFGSCSYTDANGDDYCADGWSQFQCQQVAGDWTEGGSCD